MTALDYSVSTAAAQWLTVVRTLRRHVLGDGAALRGSPRCGGDADASATTASGAGLSTASDPIVEPNRTAADPFGSLGGIVSSTPQAVGFQHEADGAQSGPGIGQTRPHSHSTRLPRDLAVGGFDARRARARGPGISTVKTDNVTRSAATPAGAVRPPSSRVRGTSTTTLRPPFRCAPRQRRGDLALRFRRAVALGPPFTR
ncbi:hypothetical protein QHI69_38455 (plasmid) [Burkholderia gladioli pv. gladioli]|uniref:hypothetical protein n=1 Tax=Burkholderia gladioli TaxID=28095 RepID=UPI0019356CFB|nr:hypothetical protein [Burkholderia gladioli]MDJ1167797.1 hypothetical protein [Burkholderia gladioli pv. gladioli]QPQ88912.1 hypothetical protein I6H08_36510 [Burkholderia gladioli]